MKRLLLVSYYFPPLAGPGVFRPLRLSKYLPQHGWQVTVLTVGEGVRALRDPALVGDVRPGTRVERARSLEPRTALIALNRLGLRGLVTRLEPWFMVPDDQIGWVPFARRRAERVLRTTPHDAVLTTAGPYSAHLVGLALRRRLGLPWIADFRDEWTTNPYLRDRYPSRWHRRLNERLERRVLEAADRVVAVSRPWLDALHGRARHLPADRFRVMTNGYDAEHFPPQPPPLPDRFRIAYTGMFYGHRSPQSFLEGARRVLRAGTVPAAEFEIVFMGHTGLVGGFGPELHGLPAETFRVVEQRPYFESIALMAEAAVLLLVVPRAGGEGNHTGKLFPYLAAGRPILTLAPEPNVAARLVRDSRSGPVVPPDDPQAIASAIERLYRDWLAGRGLEQQDRSLIAGFEASRQAEEWAALLDELPDGNDSRIVTSRRETTSSA